MINLVIFDCDGVLINSEKLALIKEIIFVQNQTKRTFNFNKYVKKFSGLSQNEWIRSINELRASQNLVKISTEEFESFIFNTNKYIMDNISVMPGILSFLSKIEKPMVVASNNNSEYLHFMLKKTGLYKFFKSNIFSADIVGVGKPEPDLFLHISKMMKCAPSNCLVIEDSLNGIIAAKRAGMKVLGFIGDSLIDKKTMLKYGADGVIKSFNDKLEQSTYNLFCENKK